MADTALSALPETSLPALDDFLYGIDSSGPTANKLSHARLLGQLTGVCDGRLTLTSGTAITTADVTAATAMYFTPYQGDRVSLYDGTRWTLYAFTERTLALGTLTSGLPYDVFLYDNAGVLTLELLAWTNDSTRATALVLQDGVLCKTGALTRRYVGSFYTTATTTTEDSATKRYLWNMYHRTRKPLLVTEAAATWTYTIDVWRQANANTANQVNVMIGQAGAVVDLRYNGRAVNTALGTGTESGIGLDATNALATGCTVVRSNSPAANVTIMHSALLVSRPAAGRHYYAWLERSDATGTTTFSGTETIHVSGLSGWVEG